MKEINVAKTKKQKNDSYRIAKKCNMKSKNKEEIKNSRQVRPEPLLISEQLNKGPDY